MIDKINLFGGLNVNPLPLEFNQSMTTSKQLLAMQTALNQIIDIVNQTTADNTEYTNIKSDSIMAIINGSNVVDAKFLKNQSVTLDKITNDSISLIHDRIMSHVGEIMKFVSFGLNDNGYFVAYVPETWGGITFSTDVDGHLVLNIKY